jgi:TRAP-type C4-dicarboxylate transport system permease small subunit
MEGMETICRFLLDLAEVDRFKVYGALVLVAFLALAVLFCCMARAEWRFLAPDNPELDWRNILSPRLKRVCMWFAASCFLLFFGILAAEAFFFS